jgi:cation diffusion facilitator family transporter
MAEQLESDAHAGGHGTRAVIAALLANLGIAAAKFIGFFLTGASSMLAEAFHSVADSGNQATLLVGGRLARRGPDPEHQFGHGSARCFAAFLVAVVLFTLGSLFSLYQGYWKLRHPHELETPAVALAILVVALVLEGLSLRTAVREADPLRGDQSWWSFIRTTKKPELAVVLLEDTAAELGLSFAFVGVGLAALTGDAMFDAFGTLAIGALLAVVAVVLGIEMYSLLVGEAASPPEQAAIRGRPGDRRGPGAVAGGRAERPRHLPGAGASRDVSKPVAGHGCRCTAGSPDRPAVRPARTCPGRPGASGMQTREGVVGQHPPHRLRHRTWGPSTGQSPERPRPPRRQS